jgi:hypothetical protein
MRNSMLLISYFLFPSLGYFRMLGKSATPNAWYFRKMRKWTADFPGTTLVAVEIHIGCIARLVVVNRQTSRLVQRTP